MYDIHLFRPPEDIESLRNTLVPQGIEISAENGQSAGYLGLNLDFLEVTATLYHCQRAGARGTPVPIKYRDRKTRISKAMASKVAEPYLWETVRYNNPELRFDPPFLASEQPMWYVFTIKSEFIPKRGNVFFFAHVDVLDGHLWEIEEENSHYHPLRERMYRLHYGQDSPRVFLLPEQK
jgi:hypothetical protein